MSSHYNYNYNYNYNYFRDYDPGIGRYIESDPIGLRGGLNTYGYVEGKTLSQIDVFGLMGQGTHGSRPQCWESDFNSCFRKCKKNAREACRFYERNGIWLCEAEHHTYSRAYVPCVSRVDEILARCKKADSICELKCLPLP